MPDTSPVGDGANVLAQGVTVLAIASASSLPENTLLVLLSTRRDTTVVSPILNDVFYYCC